MIVMCEGCETSFQVEDRLIKSTGSKVRCSKCRHVFVAYAPAADPASEEPLILSDEMPATQTPRVQAEMSEIGSRIDAIFADDLAVADETSDDQEPELLDVNELLMEDAPPASALTAESLEDDLKLDLGFDLNLDDEPVDQGVSAEAAAVSPSGDAAEIDLDLDFESAEQAASEEPLASLDELGIDLENLDSMDDGPATAEAGSAELAGVEALPEPNLDLELDAFAAEPTDASASEASEPDVEPLLSAEPVIPSAGDLDVDAGAETPPPIASELDLSDIEKMLEDELRAVESTAESIADVDLDLELETAAVEGSEKTADLEELDLTAISGEPPVDSEAAAVAADLPAGSDLLLDIEDGPEPTSAPAEPIEPQDEELDFAEITSILEETPPASENEAGPEDDLTKPELDLFASEGESETGPLDKAATADAQNDLALDIESMLENEAEREAPAEPIIGQATEEIDLELSPAPGQTAIGDLEIEIEPAADESKTDIQVGQEAVAEALERQPEAATAELPAEGPADAESDGATHVLEAEPALATAATALADEVPGLSRTRKVLLAVIGVVMLALAALVIPRSLDIHIPFLSDVDVPFLGKVFQTEPEDVAGNLKMAPVPENLSAEFIQNPGAGRLCVVRGQVRNNYDHPRSAIRVTAKLYTKDKTLAKTTTVYAGNVLSNSELAAQDMAAIGARLKNKAGANNSNMGVKPGQSISFMAVFDNLPGNLDEYSVEVAGSTK
jgi:predicted Zn finger-like uncharacterized protein